MSARNEILTEPRRLYLAPDGKVLAAYEAVQESGACVSIREFLAPASLSAIWAYAPATWGPDFLHTLPCSGYGKPLYTHCAVNGQSGEETWFGFSCYAELQFFRLLMQADGVGPKSAFKVLDSTPWIQIEKIIAANDQSGFAKLPGIGPKTAAKLLPIVFRDRQDKPKPVLNADAVAALLSLGIARVIATERVAKALAEKPSATTEELVRVCLRNA
jgi:Holliday junction DNA helicase RuvA